MIPLLAAATAVQAAPLPPVSIEPHTYYAVQYAPGPALCDGVPVRAEDMAAAIPYMVYERRGQQREVPRTIEIAFRIDAAGRPLSIRSEGQSGTALEDDVPAALAASRFALGPPRYNCRIAYRAEVARPERAPLPLVAHYLAVPHDAHGGDRPMFDRIRPRASDCDKTPARRITVYPDFQTLDGRPGRFVYTTLTYDAGADGTPANIRVVGSSGDEAMNDAAVQAMEQWRFVRDRPATGCPYTFWKVPEPVLAAPGRPEPDAALPPEQCAAGGEWDDLPPLARYFPDAFKRRRIAGWAVVRFDVASWGAIGKTQVLAAEPADAFGEAAERLVRSARKPPSERGAIGCVQTVRFALPDDGLVQGDRY